MIKFLRRFTLLLLVISSNVFAQSPQECSGSLKQEAFFPEMKAMNQEIQNEVIDYRKLEREAETFKPGSPESIKSQKRLKEMKLGLQERKKTFETMNSKYFPDTLLTAYGHACDDRRWIEKAKARLIAKPENLGGQYHVWIDIKTQQVTASKSRPRFNEIQQ